MLVKIDYLKAVCWVPAVPADVVGISFLGIYRSDPRRYKVMYLVFCRRPWREGRRDYEITQIGTVSPRSGQFEPLDETEDTYIELFPLIQEALRPWHDMPG